MTGLTARQTRCLRFITSYSAQHSHMPSMERLAKQMHCANAHVLEPTVGLLFRNKMISALPSFECAPAAESFERYANLTEQHVEFIAALEAPPPSFDGITLSNIRPLYPLRLSGALPGGQQAPQPQAEVRQGNPIQGAQV